MNQLCTYNEMRERYSGEWVLVGDPQTDNNLNVTSGTVLWHSKDRDELYRKARELKPKHSAILFFGEIPQNMAIVL